MSLQGKLARNNELQRGKVYRTQYKNNVVLSDHVKIHSVIISIDLDS